MPTETKYQFSISTDFPNHAVATRRLQNEIGASSIVTAVSRIETNGDECDVWFKDALDAGGVTALNGLVAVHSGEPPVGTMPEPVRLYSSSGVPAPVTETGMQATSATAFTPSRSYVLVGNGKAPYVAVPGATNVFDKLITADDVGADGKVEVGGGKYWTDANVQLGDYVEFSGVDKNDLLGAFVLYGLTRKRLAGLASLVGTFVVGETVTGGTSGASATVLAVGADYLEIAFPVVGTFQAAEVVTGGTSAAHAIVGSVTAGDVLELKKYVKGVPIIPNSREEIAPGTSATLVAGLFLRTYVVTVSAGTNRTFLQALDTAR